MEGARSALRLGCPVRFRDRWQGRLAALEIDDQWLVLNLVLSRGIFRPTEVKLPFSAASQWDDDHLSLDCTSEEAFGRQVPPVAVPLRPLSVRTPLSVRDARLAGALVERASRRASHLLLSWGLLAPGRRMVPIQNVTLSGGVIQLAAQTDALPIYRPDSELVEAVRDALAAHRYLTADDRRTLNVEVVDEVAHLSGNVRTPQAKAYVHEAAASVPGVTAVEETVADDRQLEIDVGRALDAAGLFRYGRIYVRSALGEVTLGGFVRAEAVIPGIVKVASGVPGVRSVDSRIEVEEATPPGLAPAAPSTPPEPAAAVQNAPEA
ncbi:MAG: BON domain-containing protein [Dehalococcoidia bacterium]|nr:MAG: BON domain-containing protein [Dehalococcoidia bacterium]